MQSEKYKILTQAKQTQFVTCFSFQKLVKSIPFQNITRLNSSVVSCWTLLCQVFVFVAIKQKVCRQAVFIFLLVTKWTIRYEEHQSDRQEIDQDQSHNLPGALCNCWSSPTHLTSGILRGGEHDDVSLLSQEEGVNGQEDDKSSLWGVIGSPSGCEAWELLSGVGGVWGWGLCKGLGGSCSSSVAST